MSRIIRMPVVLAFVVVVLVVGLAGIKLALNNYVAAGPDPSGLVFCESVHSRTLAQRFALDPSTPRVAGIWIERGANVNRPDSTPLYAGIQVTGFYGTVRTYDVWEVSPEEAFQLVCSNVPGLNAQKYQERTRRKFTKNHGLFDFSPKYPLAHLQHYGKGDNGDSVWFSSGINI